MVVQWILRESDEWINPKILTVTRVRADEVRQSSVRIVSLKSFLVIKVRRPSESIEAVGSPLNFYLSSVGLIVIEWVCPRIYLSIKSTNYESKSDGILMNYAMSLTQSITIRRVRQNSDRSDEVFNILTSDPGDRVGGRSKFHQSPTIMAVSDSHRTFGVLWEFLESDCRVCRNTVELLLIQLVRRSLIGCDKTPIADGIRLD